MAEAMGVAASSERSALRHKLPRALMLAWCVAAVPALAQSLDLGGNAAGQPASPGLDLDANAAAPVATTPSASEDSVKAGLVLRPLILPAPTDPVQNPAAPPENTPTTNAAEPLPIDHPAVLDTARLKAGDATIALFGIVGLPGDAAQGLREFIDKAGARVTCLQQASAEYICQLDDGTDVALVSLVNGAAQARADAPDAYHEQEAAAQAARRGIWASLPPPPVQVKHPSVRDTATLLADGKTYRLNGVVGLGGPYARELQGTSSRTTTASCVSRRMAATVTSASCPTGPILPRWRWSTARQRWPLTHRTPIACSRARRSTTGVASGPR
ncbi:MAG TPA: hypothetical protein VFE12_02960 [Acetobacteraceae bacterium]|nr:hypothetical protein [Acetobacteraceae bacterium]